MDGLAGWVLLGIVVLVFAYIVPAAIRSRQVVVDSRVDDRYSGDLRIVTTAGSRDRGPAPTSRVFVHAAAAPPAQEALMSTPADTADRQLAAADARRLAAARAARAAASSRRAAAARRRLLLTVVLLLGAAGTWAGFALLSWPVVAAVAATVALAGVVVLGRRAAAAGDAADARWEQEMRTIQVHARDRAASVARTAGRPRLRVDVDPTTLLVDEAASVVAAAAAHGEPISWTPVPVPPPAYTLKQSAPRRAVAPFDSETEMLAPKATDAHETLEAAPSAQHATADDGATATATASERSERSERSREASIDVQAVLARRRAAG